MLAGEAESGWGVLFLSLFFHSSWLHLAGFNLPMEEVKNFRQLHSKTPGHPEFGDAEKIRGYLSAFEEKEKLLELLEQTLSAEGVQVFIGSEAALMDVRDISVISSSYRKDGSRVGSFGLVGPTRMDYKKYVPLVAFAADVLSDVLDGRLPGTSKDS